MTGASALAATMMFAGNALAEDLLGQPTPGAIDLQPAASVLKHDAIRFHNLVLMPIIAIFVIGLSSDPDNWQHMMTNVIDRKSVV